MSIRVLHIFSPNFQTRFGGTTIRWRGNFSAWSRKQVSHFVLDTKNQRILSSEEAFAFAYKDKQTRISRFDSLRWVIELHKCLRKFKSEYDILHLHVLWWGGLLLAWWAKKNRIPSIYESVLQGSDTPVAIKSQKFGWIKLFLLRQFSAILAISEALAQEYLQSGFNESKVFVLPNCLDADLFHPTSESSEKQQLRKKFGLSENLFICLFVGSIIERKGVDLLLKSFIYLSNEYSDLFLWLIGPSTRSDNPSLDQNYVNYLQQSLLQEHLSDRVLISGLIQDRQLMAEAYRTADIFIFPSRIEGLPNVVLEAMASGLPVIVSDLPGLRNIARFGENALVVPIGDQEGLVNAVKLLIRDPELGKKIQISARRYILNHHSFSQWQSTLVQIYIDILGG